MPTTARVFIALLSLSTVANGDAIEFSGAFAERAAQIVKRPTIHAATGWESVDADFALFDWFLDHPTAAGVLWKELGLEIGSVELLADGWRSRDPDGAVLEFHRLHRSTGMRGFYCKAVVPTGAVPRVVAAEFVLIYQIHMVDAGPKGPQPVDRLEAWVSAEGAALRVVMRVANGALKSAVVRSLRQTKRYFASIARIAASRPQWAERVVVKRESFLTAEDVQQFSTLLSRAAELRAAVASSPTAGAVVQGRQQLNR